MQSKPMFEDSSLCEGHVHANPDPQRNPPKMGVLFCVIRQQMTRSDSISIVVLATRDQSSSLA